jgi:hypothetical protein
MKKVVLVCLFLLLVQFVTAEVTVAPQTETPLVFADSDFPTHYTLNVTNTGQTDNFEIYSFVGVTFKPDSGVNLKSGTSTLVDVDAYFSKSIKKNTRGLFLFEYDFYSPTNKATKHKLLAKIVDLPDVLIVTPQNFQPGDEVALVKVRNAENATFKDLQLVFSSKFFETQKTISLKPYEEVVVSLPIDSAQAKSLLAGTYPVKVHSSYKDASGSKGYEIKYLEKGGLSVSQQTKGIIIKQTTTTKTNEGNVPVKAFVTERKNIFTRLLTNVDPRPENVTKSGLYVDYSWEKQLDPAQSLIVTTTTNYTLPFAIILVIVILVILVRIYTLTNLSLDKRVSMVRTRGGEFALKVTLHVKSRSNIENITLTDHVPHAMKLYDKFGIRPDSIDESSRRVVWKIPRLNAGEGRVFSYVVYSKIRVVGNFELPLAHATYVKDGKHHNLWSNKTSFVSDTLREE